MTQPVQPHAVAACVPSADSKVRVVIDAVQPQLDGGRFPVKRVVGDRMVVQTDLLIDGHELLAGVLWHRNPAGLRVEVPLRALGNDRYQAAWQLDLIGSWQYGIEAWIDVFASFCWGLARKAQAGSEVGLELRQAAALVSAAAARATGSDAALLLELASAIDPLRNDDLTEATELALSTELRAAMDRWPDREQVVRSAAFELTVDPLQASYSTWYELFPRSLGSEGRHGTLRDVEAHLPYVAGMGFDVLYLPPIHPIGRTHRKGPNNSTRANPGDPGSPWAIGAAEGGHKAIAPELGTLDDFRSLVRAARALGIEVALDIAFQASPDHPYVQQHPEWFVKRADGSIQYAENPPKKYQDVYPFDFASSDWQALWVELKSVFSFWIEQGVRIFRVDNPHTKPLPFWSWCIGALKREHPELVFLAEAFTRPKLMQGLAKAGFSQSYTYFTWRTSKQELSEYLSSLTGSEIGQYLRPNLWPNTPDILPEHLQYGSRATFISRLVLAGTLSASYGIYGPPFELMERTAREGAEEYVDNEKYQLRRWNLEHPESLRPVIKRLNQIRRDNPALQQNRQLRFHSTSNDLLLAYSKRDESGDNSVLVVVSLDSHHTQSGWLELDREALGLRPDETVQVHDQLQDARYLWQGAKVFVQLEPSMPAHVFRLRRRSHSEKNFEYYL